MTTSSTSNAALTSILANLTNSSSSGSSTATSGPLITTGQINVSQLVGELMAIQSQPLTTLQSQEAGVKSTLSAYGQEQSALSSLQTAANALALPSAFQAASATVTGTGVSATVTGTPASANYQVNVTNLAQSQSVASTAVSATATLGTGTFTIQAGSWNAGNTVFTASSAQAIPITIDSTNDTLGGIASAINSAANGTVNASVVTDSTGSRLVLSSTNTGAANGFSVATSGAGLTPFSFAAGAQTMSSEQSATNASFSVNGLALTSATNSVPSVIAGVTLNLTQANSSSQLQVGTDPTAVTGSVNSFITAYNSFMSLTNTLTSYNATSNSASVLTGDSATRNMVSSLQSILGSQWSTTGTGPSYLGQIGVSVNTDGTLSLDSTKFQAALTANPSGVAAMFTTGGAGSAQGFAVQIGNAVLQMEGSSGALGSAQANLQSQVVYMNNKAANMEAQLSQTQTTLTAQYSALNAEISAAQAQQASLTNELASLPG